MFTSGYRILLVVVLVAAVALPTPSKAAEEPFTAFPDLKAHKVDKNNPFSIPLLPELPADAPSLRKVRHAQATVGLMYLDASCEMIRAGNFTTDEFLTILQMACETYRVAANVEETLVDRIPWYEASVRAMKTAEHFVERRVSVGSEPPERLSQIRFSRLQSEVELLRLKEEAKNGKAGRKVVIKDVAEVFRNVKVPTYTAFPDLKPPKNNPDEDAPKNDRKDEKEKEDPWDGLPVLGEDPPQLREARLNQAIEGLKYLFRIGEKMRFGTFTIDEYVSFTNYSVKTNRCLAELEDLANRPRWYEQSVVVTKDLERFFEHRVNAGADHLRSLLVPRFRRLQAEAELLTHKDEIAKSGTKPTAPGKRTPFNRDIKQEPFTAFPTIRSDIEDKLVKDESGKVKNIHIENKPVPLPDLPKLAGDAPLLRRALLEQTEEGLEYLQRVRTRIQRGTYTSELFFEFVLMASEVYHVAAELDVKSETRVAWYEASIREFKNFERYIRIRVEVGSNPSQWLDLARFHRLQAEIDLLKLKAELKKEKGK